MNLVVMQSVKPNSFKIQKFINSMDLNSITFISPQPPLVQSYRWINSSTTDWIDTLAENGWWENAYIAGHFTSKLQFQQFCEEGIRLHNHPTLIVDCISCSQRLDQVIPEMVRRGCNKTTLIESTGNVYFDETLLDCKLINSIFMDEDIFSNIQTSTDWVEMSHRGGVVPRLISVQGDVRSGIIPIYRHPADSLPVCIPFIPVVDKIRLQVEETIEKTTGKRQLLNHVLIQYYRNGLDYISDHSDKTLDIEHGSWIVNVSFGCTRTMTLQAKKKLSNSAGGTKPTISIPMTSGSCFLMSLNTNREYTHTIRQDKRPDTVKMPDELAYHGERISLTFRTISTFVHNGKIYGQGARVKDGSDSNEINQCEKEVEKMLHAFHQENKDPEFDWNQWYGQGFDCINCNPNKT
jgi:alkylated DNA repair dioxygenase AlkB